jgi:hypothetical protein
MGVSLGVEAGVDLSLDAAFGLTTELSATAGIGASFGGGVDAKLAAGFALSASGGLSAATESVKSINAKSAANASMAAFSAPGNELEAVLEAKSVSPRTPSRPVQERTPISSEVSSGGSEFAETGTRAYAPAPALPVADPRSTSFGYGVPLRPRFQPPEAGSVDVSVKLRGSSARQAFTTDPTVPGWVRLQKRRPGRTADKGKRTTRTCHSCICGPVPKKRQ